MSAPFVALALSYCIGSGTIQRLGLKARPWLELRRCETERRYLSHQLRNLRAAHDGPLEVVFDTLATHGFYDIRRIRIHSERLYHAYDLLYPRDEHTISPQVLDIVGLPGLAALWVDRIRWNRQHCYLDLRSEPESRAVLIEALDALGIKAAPRLRAQDRPQVSIQSDSVQPITKLLRPFVHTSMRHKLRPPKLLS